MSKKRTSDKVSFKTYDAIMKKLKKKETDKLKDKLKMDLLIKKVERLQTEYLEALHEVLDIAKNLEDDE